MGISLEHKGHADCGALRDHGFRDYLDDYEQQEGKLAPSQTAA
jgi:hypothetical protein